MKTKPQTHKRARTAAVFLLISLPLLLVNAAYAGNGVLDQIQNTFQSASTGWMTSALNLARPLFFGLAAIEFSWAAINYTLRKNDLGELMTSMTLKILGIAFFAMLLTEAPNWIPPIINSFVQAGQTVGGGGPTSISSSIGPSEILDAGIQTASKVVSTADKINNDQTSASVSILHPGDSIAAIGQNLLSAIFIGMSGIMILLGYLAIAVQLLITSIESYIVIGGGALMLGFAGSRWTLPFAEKYFGYAVSVGIKLFTIYIVAGFGNQLANVIIQHWNAITSAAPPNNVVGPIDFATAGITALAYGAVGYMVPGLAGSLMNGSPSMSLSNAGAAGGGMAAAPVAAGLAAGAAGARVAALASPSALGGATPRGGIGGSLATSGGPAGGVAGSRLEALSQRGKEKSGGGLPGGAAGGGTGAGGKSAGGAGGGAGGGGSQPGGAKAAGGGAAGGNAGAGGGAGGKGGAGAGGSASGGNAGSAGGGGAGGAQQGGAAKPVGQNAAQPGGAGGAQPGGDSSKSGAGGAQQGGTAQPAGQSAAISPRIGGGGAQPDGAKAPMSLASAPGGNGTKVGAGGAQSDGAAQPVDGGLPNNARAPVPSAGEPVGNQPVGGGLPGSGEAVTPLASVPGGNGFASEPPRASSLQSDIADASDTTVTADLADAAQRAFERDNKPRNIGEGVSESLHDLAERLQHESNRRQPGLTHDGQSGGVTIRMNHVE